MDDKEHLAQSIFEAKWIANGFPKSGTHLLARLLLPLAPLERGTEGGHFKQPWAGTFRDNSFSLRPQPHKQTTFRVGRISNGHMVKAHLGYDADLARFIDELGAIHVFIYRDLRDVAVSQAYHILNAEDEEKLAHPCPQIYDRDDFDTLLMQVIRGHRGFPSLTQRWEAFAPWLKDKWTIVVRFEDLLDDPEDWGGQIWEGAMHRMGDRFGVKVNFDPVGRETVTHVMAHSARQRHLSPTFRRGVAGGWREELKPDHVAALKEEGVDRWLQELGYEESEDWFIQGSELPGADYASAAGTNDHDDVAQVGAGGGGRLRGPVEVPSPAGGDHP